jgi:hypothetical protein
MGFDLKFHPVRLPKVIQKVYRVASGYGIQLRWYQCTEHSGASVRSR